MIPTFVSVIIPTYNRARYVTCAIESVLAQGEKDLEIIVIDDGSTDNTREALSAYKGTISYCYQNNAGVSTARNAGIRMAKGEWVSFLDSDDEWLPNFISLQRDPVKQHPEIVGSVMNVVNARESDTLGTIFDDRGFSPALRGESYMIEERPLLKIVEHKLTPIMIGALFRREVILEVGEFNPTLRIAEDFDFVGRMALKGPFLFGAKPVATLLRRQESTPNLTSQLFTSGIYAFECLQTVYEGFASDVSLTRFERVRLRQIMSQNLRTLGNLCLLAGRKEKARVALKKAVRADCSLRSVGRYLTSLLPTALVLQTIRKGTQIQPGPSSS
jgi:glycosyltransferase involved in cell wall biosynthesis